MVLVPKPLEKVKAALTQIIQKEKTDFFSWLIRNGKRIILDGSAGNNSVIIYTVPVGKIFWLSSANMNVTGLSGAPEAAGTALLLVRNAAVADRNIIAIRVLLSQVNSISNSYSMPLGLVQGEQIIVYTSADRCAAWACIFGYEMDANLLALFT